MAARRTGWLWKVLLPVLLALLAVALLRALARGGDLVAALRAFPTSWLAPVLGLASLNYLLRFLRWHAYLRRCGVATDRRRSAAVFFSGLAMSVTPGKFGELFKSALLKESDGVPISLSAPVVVVERLTDLAAVVGLAAIGAAYYSIGRPAIIAAAVLTAAITVPLAMSPRAAGAAARWLARRRVVSAAATERGGTRTMNGSSGPTAASEWRANGGNGNTGSVDRAARVFGRLLRGRVLILGLSLACLAWLAECTAFYVVLIGFGESAFPIAAAVFVYALATLAGALSFLPGGLGATEASMAGLLIGFGLPGRTAAAATLLIRVCTLWFAVAVGLAGYAFYRALIGARSRGSAAESGQRATTRR